MGTLMLPPISFSASTILNSIQAAELANIYIVVTFLSTGLLIFDWINNFSLEYKLIWASRRSDNMQKSLKRFEWNKWSFLLARYVALSQAIIVLVTFCLAKSNISACQSFRAFPFSFSLVQFCAHIVMILRVYGMYGQSKTILLFLGSLSLIDLSVQLVADTFVGPVFYELPSGFRICFLRPTSIVFALTFISPVIFHHIVLVLLLYQSRKHIKQENLVGISSVALVLRADQIHFTLGICLINFVNMVLVLQTGAPNYKLINYLPSMALTSIFLSRIVFSLRSYSDKNKNRSDSLSFPSSFLKNSSSTNSNPSPIHLHFDRRLDQKLQKIESPPSPTQHSSRTFNSLSPSSPGRKSTLETSELRNSISLNPLFYSDSTGLPPSLDSLEDSGLTEFPLRRGGALAHYRSTSYPIFGSSRTVNSFDRPAPPREDSTNFPEEGGGKTKRVGEGLEGREDRDGIKYCEN